MPQHTYRDLDRCDRRSRSTDRHPRGCLSSSTVLLLQELAIDFLMVPRKFPRTARDPHEVGYERIRSAALRRFGRLLGHPAYGFPQDLRFRAADAARKPLQDHFRFRIRTNACWHLFSCFCGRRTAMYYDLRGVKRLPQISNQLDQHGSPPGYAGEAVAA